MERKSIWKNFLILAVGGLIVFHVDFAGAQTSSGSGQGNDDEGCVLTDD